MMKQSNRGFTLIEVLIALVIVAIALVSGIKIVSQYAYNLSGIQERTWAYWVAMNHIVDLQLHQQWPDEGEVKGSEIESPYQLEWVRRVESTPYERMRRVDVVLSLPHHDTPLVKMKTYVGRESSW